MVSRQIDISRPLAPEDIRPGDYIAIMSIMIEWPSFFFDCAFDKSELVRTVHLPCEGGSPLRVESVCLPFVLVCNAKDEHSTLDLRRYRVARLSERFGKKASKKLGNKREKEKYSS